MGYLARVSTDAAAAFAGSLDGAHGALFWITSRASVPAPDGGAFLFVTTARGPGGVDPKRLGEMRSTAASFLDAHPGGVLIMDCLDLLATHNGVERVVRAIEDMHDDVTTKGGSLIVFVDPRTTNARLIAWLERELEELPTALPGTPSPDVLVA